MDDLEPIFSSLMYKSSWSQMSNGKKWTVSEPETVNPPHPTRLVITRRHTNKNGQKEVDPPNDSRFIIIHRNRNYASPQQWITPFGADVSPPKSRLIINKYERSRKCQQITWPNYTTRLHPSNLISKAQEGAAACSQRNVLAETYAHLVETALNFAATPARGTTPLTRVLADVVCHQLHFLLIFQLFSHFIIIVWRFNFSKRFPMAAVFAWFNFLKPV